MLSPSPSGPSTPHQPADEGDATARSWWERRWVWVTGLSALVVVGLVVGAFFVRVPYYAFSPGTLRPTAQLVQIDGAEVYPPDGTILLTTVSISRQRLTVWGAFAGWLDPTVTVVNEEVVLGGADREQTRQINLRLMDNSKDIATYVALDRLGYDVEFVGTGAMVTQVSPDTPADGVLDPGDTVVSVNGDPVELASDLVEAIGSLAPGATATLVVEPLENDEAVERTVTLAARDDDSKVAFLGVVPQTRDARFVFPVEVEISTGQVGGPSAGLSFTLTLLDLLTPGELTGGKTVAVTGTIDVEGNVGPIGGVEQKAAAARRDGIEIFIVPRSIAQNELDAARRQAGDAVEIIEVDTLDEALAALEALGGDPLVVPAKAA